MVVFDIYVTDFGHIHCKATAGITLMNQMFNEAFFAGRIFVLGEQDGFKFLMWGNFPIGDICEPGVHVHSTMAEPFEGAFLCEMESGWLLVAGIGRYRNLRHSFFDDSENAKANAMAVQKLGVPVVSTDEGNQRVKTDGVSLYSITGEEKRRAKHA